MAFRLVPSTGLETTKLWCFSGTCRHENINIRDGVMLYCSYVWILKLCTLMASFSWFSALIELH